jgi:hypothetical protein
VGIDLDVLIAGVLCLASCGSSSAGSREPVAPERVTEAGPIVDPMGQVLCPAVTPPRPASASEVDALVAAVLARIAGDRSTVADFGLLPAAGPVYVATETERGPRVSARMLPSGGQFQVKTLREIQAEADRRGADVSYIRFWSARVAGSCAAIDVGVDIELPSSTSIIKMCCCHATDIYDQRDGQWVFRTRSDAICI